MSNDIPDPEPCSAPIAGWSCDGDLVNTVHARAVGDLVLVYVDMSRKDVALAGAGDDGEREMSFMLEHEEGDDVVLRLRLAEPLQYVVGAANRYVLRVLLRRPGQHDLGVEVPREVRDP